MIWWIQIKTFDWISLWSLPLPLSKNTARLYQLREVNTYFLKCHLLFLHMLYFCYLAADHCSCLLSIWQLFWDSSKFFFRHVSSFQTCFSWVSVTTYIRYFLLYLSEFCLWFTLVNILDLNGHSFKKTKLSDMFCLKSHLSYNKCHFLQNGLKWPNTFWGPFNFTYLNSNIYY